MSPAKTKTASTSTNGNGHALVLTRETRRRELIEACELLRSLRGLTARPENGGLPVLMNESKLVGRALQMAEWDVAEAMAGYLGERMMTSETFKTREAKSAFYDRVIGYLRENRWLQIHFESSKHTAEAFLSNDKD